ncbi:ABC transporter ATP-binding protein [Tengunoibacter tsumagoiensis]|uniref:ABC transporter ATP-binding protein n=1 Tax=Tengunoibacter tsumagoiensis TaxID=2014871 RepID=A0A402A6N2_9CHLR|nr:ABC transporter ATP-binding protein [Tengunoibacter tsumagoiensis]GCE14749.1 ABC transporter ATP-binding protein [Tengunoibacter tsumagoiensis]
MSEAVIEVEGLWKIYHQLVAVEDVHFTMYRGEAFGFLGPNGAGKSTIVKMLLGLVEPTAGRIRVLGEPVSHLPTRRRIGYLPELPHFHRWLKAGEFLQFHGQLYGLRGQQLRSRSSEALELVGLSGREKQKLGTFSKGMLQRIGLAQALLNRPELLILDELVSGLDPVGVRDMRELLLQLKREGISIFLNSHQLADVEALCDRVAIINQGQIIKIGVPAQLFVETIALDIRVDTITDELLERLRAVTLAIQTHPADPGALTVEIEREEIAADIAEIIHQNGRRLYLLAPQKASLEHLFLQTIDSARQRAKTALSEQLHV